MIDTAHGLCLLAESKQGIRKPLLALWEPLWAQLLMRQMARWGWPESKVNRIRGIVEQPDLPGMLSGWMRSLADHGQDSQPRRGGCATDARENRARRKP